MKNPLATKTLRLLRKGRDEPYQKTCENLPYPEDYEPVSNVSHSD